jgi:hypothetical protein
MYRGDGSYKASEYNNEVSLKELLDIEYELVNKLNEDYRAYEIAKKTSLKTTEYKERIRIGQDKLRQVRMDIKEYCYDKLGLKTDFVAELYQEKEKQSERRKET